MKVATRYFLWASLYPIGVSIVFLSIFIMNVSIAIVGVTSIGIGLWKMMTHTVNEKELHGVGYK